jgi:Uri superfamily endonuclease
MSRAISIVVFGALFSMLQGSASADEQSLSDQCRAKIRAQIKGTVCQKSQADQQNDPCYISAREAMQFGLQDRIDRCVDRGKVRRWHVAV